MTGGLLVAEGAESVSPDPCPSFVTVAPGREVRCAKPAGHGPAEDIHQGLLRVTLPDGREQTAFLVWTTWPIPWDEENLRSAT
jgi:hypothetical protein